MAQQRRHGELHRSDGNGSGVASTQYSVDGATWTTGTSVTIPAPANGDNDGVHTINYYSTDNAGNPGSVQGCVVKIDTNGPVTVDNAAGVWHEVPFTLQLSATDKSTADTTTQYSLGDDQHWQTETPSPSAAGSAAAAVACTPSTTARPTRPA